MTRPLSSPEIDALLNQALARAFAPEVGVPPRLEEAVRYSLFGPGKRLRPRLALSAARLFGLPGEAAAAAACALELFHCFTLIHDDLPCLDNDDERRGRPSNHRRFDEGTALLAGDALHSLAWETLLHAATAVPADRVIAAARRFGLWTGAGGVIGGQVAEFALGKESTLASLRRMHAMKTGALFEAALLVPLALAGIEESSPKGRAVAEFARALGSAFQILDDLEDAEQDGERTPVNIAFYVEPAEARSIARTELESGLQSLAEAFGPEPASDLLALGQESLARLEVDR